MSPRHDLSPFKNLHRANRDGQTRFVLPALDTTNVPHHSGESRHDESGSSGGFCSLDGVGIFVRRTGLVVGVDDGGRRELGTGSSDFADLLFEESVDRFRFLEGERRGEKSARGS